MTEPAGRGARENARARDTAPVPDLLTVPLGADARALVCGDLHLGQAASPASARLEQDLAELLARWSGPGVVVLNGDVVELWAEPDASFASALDAHPVLTAALRDFTRGPDRELVVVVGNHDAAAAWDGVSPAVVAERLGGRCALAVDLRFDTPSGPRVVRCEHGHAYDPANALRDPRDPLDSPLGQHVVQEVLPELRRTPLLADASALTDPDDVGRFLASRLVYRQLGGRLWWLLVPLLVAVALRTPVLVRLLSRAPELGQLRRWLLVAGIGVAVDVAVLTLLAVLVARAVYASLTGSHFGPRGIRLNGPAKVAAAALCGRGFAGLVTGHTHQPELVPLSGGFYANNGCATRALVPRPARLFLPPVFVPVLRRTWIELDVTRDLRARLVACDAPTGEVTWLERLVLRPWRLLPETPEVVATVPGQAGWPLRQRGLAWPARSARVRRVAAVLVGGIAVLGVASAVLPPRTGRLAALLAVLPVQAPQAAAAGVAFVNAGLLVVAWGLRRGRRTAWAAAVGLLAASAALHLVKGLDAESALLTLALAGWLAGQRGAFPVHPDRRQWRAAATVLAVGLVLATLASLGLVGVFGARADPDETAREVAERVVGDTAGPLPWHSPVIAPALAAAVGSVVVAVGWLLLRPRLRRPPTTADRAADLGSARRLVRRYGGDTLSYAALRAGASWFFSGDCVVAYDVRDGACVVSPDPVGPLEQWAETWAQFTAYAHRHGWQVGVRGAAEGWLPLYAATGLRRVHLGDEAIVDCARFSLDEPATAELRDRCHRIRRAGYTVRFHDPARLPPERAEQLRLLVAPRAGGTTRREFSLSRLFEPADTGLLLAVAYDRAGRPDAFCHWTPAADIAGWSLDVTGLRDGPDLPVGLTDLVVVETINRVKARGGWGVALGVSGGEELPAGSSGWYDAYHPIRRPRYALRPGRDGAPAGGSPATEMFRRAPDEPR